MLVWMAYAMLIGAFMTTAALVADGVLRGRGRATRWAWSAAMVVTVALPLLAFVPARTASATLVAVSPGASVPTRELPVVENAPDALSATATSPLAATSPLTSPRYGRFLAIGWVVMSGALLLCLAAAAAMLVRRRQGWRAHSVEGVDVLIAADAGPAAVGLIRPRIVLPVWALDADRESLRLMLAHESEHVRARDPLLLGAASLLLAVMPWNPALWWQAARLRDGIELDCDGRVLRTHPEPRRYADVLLHVARGESRWLLASPGMARRRSLERRIRRLAGSRRWSRAATASGCAAIVALLAVACGVERPAVRTAAAATPVSEGIATAGSGGAGSGGVATVDVGTTSGTTSVTTAVGVGSASTNAIASSDLRAAELARVSVSTGPSAEHIRAVVARRHPELMRDHDDGVGVWVIASPNGQALHTGSGPRYRSSRDVTRELGDANGYTFSSIILTSVETDDGDLPVAWAILEEGVHVSAAMPSGRVTCSTRRNDSGHHLVVEMAPSEEGSFAITAQERGRSDAIAVSAQGEDFSVSCSGGPVTLSGLPASGFEIQIAGDVPEFEVLIVRGESRHTMTIRPGETLNSRVR